MRRPFDPEPIYRAGSVQGEASTRFINDANHTNWVSFCCNGQERSDVTVWQNAIVASGTAAMKVSRVLPASTRTLELGESWKWNERVLRLRVRRG